MKFTRMDWYPWDFDEDEYVKLLPWAQQNAYMRILTVMWKWADKHDTVDLPDDDFRIAGAIGISVEEWAPLRERLVDHPASLLKRDPEAGVIFSSRMREEYQKALDRSAQAKENGSKGGRPKNAREPVENPQVYDGFADAKPPSTRSKAHISLNKDQETENQGEKIKPMASAGASDYSPDFVAFWAAYPRHIEKAKAWKAWQTRIREGNAPDDIILAARHYAQICVAHQTELRFIKHPATFLSKDQPFRDYIQTPTVNDLKPRAAPNSPAPDNDNRSVIERFRSRWQSAEGGIV